MRPSGGQHVQMPSSDIWVSTGVTLGCSNIMLPGEGMEKVRAAEPRERTYESLRKAGLVTLETAPDGVLEMRLTPQGEALLAYLRETQHPAEVPKRSFPGRQLRAKRLGKFRFPRSKKNQPVA